MAKNTHRVSHASVPTEPKKKLYPVHIGSKRTKAKHVVITKKHIVSHMHRFQPNKKITTMSLLKKHIVSHMHRSQPNKIITYCHSILFVIIAVLRPLWGPCGAYSQSLPTEDDRSRHPSVEDNRRSQCWLLLLINFVRFEWSMNQWRTVNTDLARVASLVVALIVRWEDS